MKRYLPLVIIAVTTIILVVSFFIYQGVTRTQCDGIFEQTADKLNGSIKALKSEVSLSFGREKIQDLTEASQMVGLRLKACCISHKANAINTEQVMMCINNTQKSEKKIVDISNTIKAANDAYKKGDHEQASKKIDDASREINILRGNTDTPNQTLTMPNTAVMQKHQGIDQSQATSRPQQNASDGSNPKPVENTKETDEDRSSNNLKPQSSELTYEPFVGGRKVFCYDQASLVLSTWTSGMDELAKIGLNSTEEKTEPVIILNAIALPKLPNDVQVFMFFRQCSKIIATDPKNYSKLDMGQELYLDCITIKHLRNARLIDDDFVETVAIYFTLEHLRNRLGKRLEDLLGATRQRQLRDCYITP